MARSRFDFVKYDDNALEKSAKLKEHFKSLEALIVRTCGTEANAHVHLALLKLEESFMWCGKAIRDHQLDQNTRSEVV